jgi:hypothetical protein
LTVSDAVDKLLNMAEVNPLDSDSVMDQVGDVVPIILREAMDSGFDVFRRSRDLDPVAHADYSPTTLAGMLTDRIYPFLVSLTNLVDPQGLLLQTRRTPNDRATELFVGADFYIKVKRVKDKRRQATPADDVEVDGLMDVEIIEEGLPKNLPTRRVRRQFSPLSTSGRQAVFPFAPVHTPGDEYDRWCLFAGFDIDLTEERLSRHRIGLYERKRSIWTLALPELELDTIAQISPDLAAQVDALRQARQA